MVGMMSACPTDPQMVAAARSAPPAPPRIAGVPGIGRMPLDARLGVIGAAPPHRGAVERRMAFVCSDAFPAIYGPGDYVRVERRMAFVCSDAFGARPPVAVPGIGRATAIGMLPG